MITPHRIDGTLLTGVPVVAWTGHREVPAAHEVHVVKTINHAWPGLQVVHILGGAMGLDTIAAEALLGCAHNTVVIARPFEGHERLWTFAHWGDRFREVWRRAHVRITVCNAPEQVRIMQAYHIRNGYMLQLAEQALRELGPGNGFVDAYWDGRTTGGTYACLREAHRRGLKANNLPPLAAPGHIVLPGGDEPAGVQGRLFA